MIRLRSQLIGQAGAQRALDELGRNLSDLSPAWRAMLADWKSSQKKLFDSEGSSAGVRWAPLSPRYAAWKAKRFPGRGMLQMSGGLEAAAEGRGSGFTQQIAPLTLRFAITHRLAAIHQGARARRQVTAFSKNDERRWHRILVEFVDRAVRKVS